MTRSPVIFLLHALYDALHRTPITIMSDVDCTAAMLPFERRTVNMAMFKTCVYDTVPSRFRVASQLNRWLLIRRRASVQRTLVTAPVRRCQGAAAHLELVYQSERPHTHAILRCAVMSSVGRLSAVWDG